VSVEVGKLLDAGLISLDEDKAIRLTDAGRAIAEETYEKHCYFKAFLLAAGVDEETADREACAIEHAVGGETFRKIKAVYPLP
ncbi:MAG: metal-dependent transcriptional regulator, partial [Oscillospiraceae bacterium]|nr:metal-dependent transcriptional regulator [Oscillospiraceae bacterium]